MDTWLSRASSALPCFHDRVIVRIWPWIAVVRHNVKTASMYDVEIDGEQCFMRFRTLDPVIGKLIEEKAFNLESITEMGSLRYPSLERVARLALTRYRL